MLRTTACYYFATERVLGGFRGLVFAVGVRVRWASDAVSPRGRQKLSSYADTRDQQLYQQPSRSRQALTNQYCHTALWQPCESPLYDKSCR